jgi:predicted patatin/cPLA2 family phospholipase
MTVFDDRRIAVTRAIVILAASLAIALACPPVLSFDTGSAFAQSKKKKKPAPPPKHQELTRIPFTAQEQAAAIIPGIPDARVWGDSAADFRRVLPSKEGPWLALSGGGADGAFGAGVLTGWSQSGQRPEFAVVTGASIGALIGVYAFVGPAYDEELGRNFTEITAADVFEDHTTPESLLDTWPLKRLIEKRVTKEMLAAVAAEHRKGRRFYVVTTNMDAGRRVIWNMGAIAEHADAKALKLFRDVLLASSSIPGFFQPVAIDVEANGKKFQEMHSDGTITAPFFVMPEEMLTSASSPANDVYVIMNSKVASDFSMPERKLNSVLARAIGVALTAGMRAEVLLISASARRLGMNLHVAHVPDSFDQVNRGLFDHVYMEALFKYGVEQASKGTIFTDAAGKAEHRTENPQ